MSETTVFGLIILHVPEQEFIRETNIQEQENKQTNKQTETKTIKRTRITQHLLG